MVSRNRLDDVIILLEDSIDQGLVKELLKLLFTSKELNQLLTRYAIIEGLIQNNFSQRELSQKFKVSIEKITRGSNELKRIPRNLKKYLEKFFKEQK